MDEKLLATEYLTNMLTIMHSLNINDHVFKYLLEQTIVA